GQVKLEVVADEGALAQQAEQGPRVDMEAIDEIRERLPGDGVGGHAQQPRPVPAGVQPGRLQVNADETALLDGRGDCGKVIRTVDQTIGYRRRPFPRVFAEIPPTPLPPSP